MFLSNFSCSSCVPFFMFLSSSWLSGELMGGLFSLFLGPGWFCWGCLGFACVPFFFLLVLRSLFSVPFFFLVVWGDCGRFLFWGPGWLSWVLWGFFLCSFLFSSRSCCGPLANRGHAVEEREDGSEHLRARSREPPFSSSGGGSRKEVLEKQGTQNSPKRTCFVRQAQCVAQMRHKTSPVNEVAPPKGPCGIPNLLVYPLYQVLVLLRLLHVLCLPLLLRLLRRHVYILLCSILLLNLRQ